jgi:hypothetical protein
MVNSKASEREIPSQHFVAWFVNFILFSRVEYATAIVITSMIPAVIEKPGSIILAFPPQGICRPLARGTILHLRYNHS